MTTVLDISLLAHKRVGTTNNNSAILVHGPHQDALSAASRSSLEIDDEEKVSQKYNPQYAVSNALRYRTKPIVRYISQLAAQTAE